MTHEPSVANIVLNFTDRILRRLQNAISDVHPSFERMLMTPVRYYAISWIRTAEMIGSVKYDAPIDPMQIYHVDPRQINRTVTWTRISTDLKADEHPRFRPPNYRLAARVFDGDWDTVDAQFTDSTIYRSFAHHYKDKVPWEETRFYKHTLSAMEDGATLWNCTSQSELDERCKRLDELFDHIATEGYKTQNELYESGDPTTSSYRIYRIIWGEIAVNVGRDGEFIFLDGRNRLSIARILELEEVPVVILVRHEKWQRKRDQIIRGELNASDLPKNLRTHPDLINLFCY